MNLSEYYWSLSFSYVLVFARLFYALSFSRALVSTMSTQSKCNESMIVPRIW